MSQVSDVTHPAQQNLCHWLSFLIVWEKYVPEGIQKAVSVISVSCVVVNAVCAPCYLAHI